jgi:N-acetylmuramoyl-L-alanine amidase
VLRFCSILSLVMVLIVSGCVDKRSATMDSTCCDITTKPSVQYPAEWYPNVPAQDWQVIVIHHSASDIGGAQRFDEWHKARGWLGLGYDFVIGNGTDTPDGCIEVGPRWTKQMQGAHAGNTYFNKYGIGINLVGNYEHSTPTPKQMASLRLLLHFLMERYHISPEKIYGHREVPDASTLCPGEYFPLIGLRYWLKNNDESVWASSLD